MKYLGSYETEIDDKGRVVFPSAFRRNWPTPNQVQVGIERSSKDAYLVCLPASIDSQQYRNTRAAHNVKHQIPTLNDISFITLPITNQYRIQLGRLIQEANMETPLVWINSGLGALYDFDAVELWQKSNLDALIQDYRTKNAASLSRSLWPY